MSGQEVMCVHRGIVCGSDKEQDWSVCSYMVELEEAVLRPDERDTEFPCAAGHSETAAETQGTSRGTDRHRGEGREGTLQMACGCGVRVTSMRNH